LSEQIKSIDVERERIGRENEALRKEVKELTLKLNKLLIISKYIKDTKSLILSNIDFNYMQEVDNKSDQKKELKSKEVLIETLRKSKEELEQSLINLQNEKNSLVERLESKIQECEDKEKQCLELNAQLSDLKTYKDEIELLKAQLNNAENTVM
jgi:DNA repair exonuclease SbcCD ATPase subunit